MNFFGKVKIGIQKIEERERDSWFDIGLRQFRDGVVRFYRVNDPFTGVWLFKVCLDAEGDKVTIKALKCPPGRLLSQLEGSTMLFQKSLVEGCHYDVVSIPYVDEDGRLHRRIVDGIEGVPEIIRENFKVAPYEEAVGKKVFGEKLVVLCPSNDDRRMITLFIIERAWTLSKITPEIKDMVPEILKLIRDLERVNISEVYEASKTRYNLTEEETRLIIDVLERDGKIKRMNGYLKTNF